MRNGFSTHWTKKAYFSRLCGCLHPPAELGGCILVNRFHPATRQRWTLAHEFAHHLTRPLRGEVALLTEHDRQPRSELFADRFAAQLLMPATGVRLRFRETLRASGDFRVADLCRLANFYAVSVEAMCRRLEDLRLVPSGTWEAIQRDTVPAAEARRRLGLPDDPGIGSEFPARYQSLAVRLFLEAELSEAELARYLRTDRVDARRVVEELCRATEMGPHGDIGTIHLNPGEAIPVVGA